MTVTAAQTGNRSRQFRRVSTNAQDYRKQLADLAAWDSSHGYTTDGAHYLADGKSAYHGKQIPELDRAVAAMEAGEYDRLVFWAADRMWRGESLAAALAYTERIHNAGGSIEFVKDPHLNVAEGVPAYVRNMLLAQAFGAAHAESERKSQRSKMDIQSKQETGSAHGRAPWGYEIVGEKDHKRFVPTAEGRKYVPEIYRRVIAGESLRTIAEYLDSEGVKTAAGNDRWHEAFIGNRLIKNPVYHGARRNGGKLETEEIVSATTWREAQAALASRVRRGGPEAIVNPKPLVKPVCGECKQDSPMYRVYVGKEGHRTAYYRCTGKGAQRKGCGAPMVRCDFLDAAVVDSITSKEIPHRERTFVPGDDNADAVTRAQELGAEAMRKGDYDAAMAHMAEAKRLGELPTVAAHWDTRIVPGVTEADYFGSLDHDAQREYLATWWISATTEGVSMGPREW